MCSDYSSLCVFFFLKQKTAYEMRISDWSSDVCSSDLISKGLCTTSALLAAENSPGRGKAKRDTATTSLANSGAAKRKPLAPGLPRCCQSSFAPATRAGNAQVAWVRTSLLWTMATFLDRRKRICCLRSEEGLVGKE